MIPTSKTLIAYIGKNTLASFENLAVRAVVKDYCEKLEKEHSIIKAAEIKGTRLHNSTDDPNDEKMVVSIRCFDTNGKRVGTAHVHEDGTGKIT
ncbi:hypothetical protein NX059_001629 [Plenodomus lindquistii]|nr:hypothetical protein NX059_001629 [Plenodomus lindquistii]